MEIENPYIARVSVAGQFCLVTAPEAFLRRPLSIYSAGGGRLSFLYRVVGKGTEALSGMKTGQSIGVLGPLGTGYDERPVKKGAYPLLVGGGTGIASLSFLSVSMPKPGTVLYGARCAADIVPLPELRGKRWNVVFSTLDGSRGHEGLVTDTLDRWLDKNKHLSPVIYACGPRGMLKAVAERAERLAIPCQVSLEEMMACGVGNCQGCAVKTTAGHRMACKDGPVFRSNEIIW